VGGEKSHITDPGSDIEHAHSRSKACLVEEVLGDFGDQTTLPIQAMVFGSRPAENVFSLRCRGSAHSIVFPERCDTFDCGCRFTHEPVEE
jgi:hypothetical protein